MYLSVRVLLLYGAAVSRCPEALIAMSTAGRKCPNALDHVAESMSLLIKPGSVYSRV